MRAQIILCPLVILYLCIRDSNVRPSQLNEQYKSYDFSMREAVSSRPKALIDYRKRGVADIVNNALVNYGDGESLTLPQDACEDLIKSERDLLEVGGKLVQDLKKARAEVRGG